jgi:hypothetical protein
MPEMLTEKVVKDCLLSEVKAKGLLYHSPAGLHEIYLTLR